jgi:hypothetical protein
MKRGKRCESFKIMNKKIIGYVLFGLAFCMWIFPAFIGLINLPTKEKAILLTTIIILGEVFFVLSIIFLGKEFLLKMKHFFLVRWRWIFRKIHKNK